ncbi:DMT family transporter [Allorhizobium taibaishanense]|uniref:Drug/metabolite transporter (DMT)-like permease n=2 Tax=Allorhizobium taibaishanense TaxID=887144 RepID=A0A7W6HQF5_9HYPH|nr:DMT family transporter [Allorhizobium taibaishanense]MBB4009516.1 drug/metabolite transporter (DMT)-like permease [Allorhizobium taibaishanense]
MAKQMGAREWAMLLTLSVLWGGSFLFIGILVKVWPPLTIVTARVAIAAIALWLIVGLSGQPVPRSGKVWLAFFGMGLLNNVIPFTLIVWGQTHIPVGLAAIFNATTPLFGVLIAHVLTADEKLTANRLTGVLIGVFGVAVMIGPSVFSHISGDLWGELAVMLAALSYAFAGLFGRRFKAMGLPPLLPAAGQVTAATIILLPITMMVDAPWTLPAPNAETVAALLGLALLSTAVGYVLFFRILASAGATNIMLVTILIPPSAILLGALVLGDQVAPRHLLGMVLIALGLAAIDGRMWRRLRSRAVRSA